MHKEYEAIFETIGISDNNDRDVVVDYIKELFSIATRIILDSNCKEND